MKGEQRKRKKKESALRKRKGLDYISRKRGETGIKISKFEIIKKKKKKKKNTTYIEYYHIDEQNSSLAWRRTDILPRSRHSL